jgi:uncharacterized protein
MERHYIIDGYNLMKTDPELAMLQRGGLEFARDALIKRVEMAAGLKKALSITLVFDGHKGGQVEETRQRRGRILIIFSKLGESADEVIKQLVASYTSPQEVKVITRDWELKDAAREAGQTSGTIKRRPSQVRPNPGAEDNDEGGWRGTTKKKGPDKRNPKSKRRKGPGNDVYW